MHAERFGAPRRTPRHIAECIQPERLPKQARNLAQQRPRLVPLTFPRHAHHHRRASRQVQQQPHGMIGHLLDEHVRDVGDHDAGRDQEPEPEGAEDPDYLAVGRERGAKDGPFGATIAHGYLTLSLVNLFLPQILEVRGVSMGVNYGTDKVRFPAVVPVGSRVRGCGEVISVEEVKGTVQVVVRVSVEVEGGDRPACVADTISRFVPA